MRKLLSPAAIGRWSMTHPWRAISAWLAFVAIALAALALTGSKQLENGGAGESARADALMARHQVGLSQREYAYVHTDALPARDPRFHNAVEAVAARMRNALGGPVRIRISGDPRSALVAGEIHRSFSIGALQASIGSVGTAHPGVHTANWGGWLRRFGSKPVGSSPRWRPTVRVKGAGVAPARW